jgi:peroxiredoxin
MALKPGDKAPALSLYDSDKQKLSLDDLAGKNVLLLFFPLAFSRVCTMELCNLRDNIAIYNEVQAEVLGISVDSIYVLDRFKKAENLNFTLLSDFNKEVSAGFDVLYDVFPSYEMRGVSKRAAFVIDKKGTIQYIEICATPGELPNFDAIQQVLRTLS